MGRDVSHLSDDQLRNLMSELERRFRDEALTRAAAMASILLFATVNHINAASGKPYESRSQGAGIILSLQDT